MERAEGGWHILIYLEGIVGIFLALRRVERTLRTLVRGTGYYILLVLGKGGRERSI